MTLNQSSQEYFYTSDLALATVLSTKHKILEVDQSQPNKSAFCFKRSQKLLKLVEMYRNYEVLLPPQEFLDRYKNLKASLVIGR